MARKVSNIGWLATGLALSGLAMTPAISRVLAENTKPVSLKALGTIGSFTTVGADPKLAASFKLDALRGNSKFKFTPAGGSLSGDRAMTVVVRQNSSARAISVRENLALAKVGSGLAIATKITPTSYSLGAAKGLSSFAIPIRKTSGNIPDLGEVGAKRALNNDAPEKKSRFNTRFSLDAKTQVEAAPRALAASEKDYSLDVGGSYSLTRNLDVMAGVRYKNERDRLAPLTDSRQDSQAVYVGTQFRF